MREVSGVSETQVRVTSSMATTYTDTAIEVSKRSSRATEMIGARAPPDHDCLRPQVHIGRNWNFSPAVTIAGSNRAPAANEPATKTACGPTR